MTKDKLLQILEKEMKMESKVINEQIGTDHEMGTLQDNGRLGRLQGIHWVWSLIKQLDTIVIPDNATNGDVLKALFPTCETRNPREDIIEITLDGVIGIPVIKDWWDASYKVNK